MIQANLDNVKRPAASNASMTSSSIIDVRQIYAPVDAHLNAVKISLAGIVTPETVVLAQSISHSLHSAGKLFRPLLMLLMSGATGPISDAHIETAAVAELIHVATLLHDDVLDESDARRGQQTVRAQWGNKVSILSGDYLLAQASLKLSQLNNCRLVSIFAKVLAHLCEGEVEQMVSAFDLETTWDSYYKKSICKTAALFSACCESAGVLNGLTELQIVSLRTFGEKFGIAFQMVDDLLDYTSSEAKLGKPVLDDLKNGILNAPILIALESFSPESSEYQRLQEVIQALFHPEGSKTTLDEAQTRLLKQSLFDLFSDVNAIGRTQDLAEQFAEEAREAIAFLPESDYKLALLDLTRYATRRDF